MRKRRTLPTLVRGFEGVYRFFRGLGVDRHQAPTAALEIGSQLLQLRSQT
jgi:hypothetical protein